MGIGPGASFALARYNTNGTLDPTFAGDGRQTTNFGAQDGAHGVVLQADGKIVAVGRAGGGGLAVGRYMPNGSLDPTFSGDGKQTANPGTGEAKAVALQANGKIVVAGTAGFGPESRAFVVARFNPNGSLDASFSGDGVQVTVFAAPGSNRCRCGARGVAVRSDGKIIAVGFAGVADFALARYNPNGSLDPNFSGDGKQVTDFGGAEYANAVALQPDGKVVAVGSQSGEGIFFAFALARYNANGSLDPSFSGDGKQLTNFGGDAVARGVALQGDGKIVAVGKAITGEPADQFAVARYNPNGALDPTFSGDGRQRTGFGEGGSANAVAIQPDGKIVAVGGGELANAGNDDFLLARYLGG